MEVLCIDFHFIVRNILHHKKHDEKQNSIEMYKQQLFCMPFTMSISCFYLTATLARHFAVFNLKCFEKKLQILI